MNAVMKSSHEGLYSKHYLEIVQKPTALAYGCNCYHTLHKQFFFQINSDSERMSACYKSSKSG